MIYKYNVLKLIGLMAAALNTYEMGSKGLTLH